MYVDQKQSWGRQAVILPVSAGRCMGLLIPARKKLWAPDLKF